MELQSLKRAYQKALPRLKKDLHELQSAIVGAIDQLEREREKAGLPANMFRIRLREARIKDVESIYRKALEDEIATPAIALSAEHMPDILGARIVCHNTSDVYSIFDKLRTGKFGRLHYAERPSGSKDFIKEPKDDGYRAVHIDMRWDGPPGDKRIRRAELQIRTLLQDAWATFMHDDVYKLRDLLPDDVTERARDMSEVLRVYDEVADDLRSKMEKAKASPGSNVKLVEALEARMYAYFSGFRTQHAVNGYREIRRNDQYEVKDHDARYNFTFDGTASRSISPHFVVAGDSGSAGCQDRKAFLVDDAGKHVKLGWIEDERDRNVLIIHDNEKRKKHVLEVSCTWKGIFFRSIEYVVAPWSALYPGAVVDYTLSLVFNRKPRYAPMAFQQSAISGMSDALDRLHRQEDGSIQRQVLKVKGKYVYRFARKAADLDLIVLFSI